MERQGGFVDWVNLHHLQYFRLIAREGGLSGAARVLRLTHSTLSAQLRALEEALGAALFERKGRRLVLTPFGEQVLVFAEGIHRVQLELLDFARSRATPDHRRPFRVGVVDVLPKTVVARLLEPIVADRGWGPVEVRERPLETLVGDLVSGRVHVAISDEPVAQLGVHAHLLGRSGLSLYGSKSLARRYRPGFPKSLCRAPMVLPCSDLALRRSIDRWLTARDVTVSLEAELDDAAMLRVFGAMGLGLFPVRNALRAEVEDLYDVERVGELDGVVEEYYALSVERRVRDEGVALLIESARRRLDRSSR